MNPQHLKLLPDGSALYRHLTTLAFTQHGPAQRGFAADDLNELIAELDALTGVLGSRAELAPMGRPHGLLGLLQVFCEPVQHLLLQEFIHDERYPWLTPMPTQRN